MFRPRARFAIWTAVALVAAIAVPAQVSEDTSAPRELRREQAPDELEGVGITEHLDAQLPMDVEFRDERGNPVRLGELFRGDRPVILTLVYYRCPMLCGLVLDGLTDGLQDLDWSVGDEFDVVTISIDPVETHTLATLKKQNQLKVYGRPGADTGWRFLTGTRESIAAVADTIGFGFTYVESRNEYAHSAAIFLLTPDGRVSRYLYGVLYEPETLRMALLEASEGKIGTVVDRVLMYCFHYDADEGRYSVVARNVMKLGGGVTLVVLGAILLVFWSREMRRRNRAPQLKGSES